MWGRQQEWVPDSQAPQCNECKAEFTLFLRRHHCPLCGNVFCERCAGYWTPARVTPGPEL
eukprot:COSAG01_NODE_49934_length_368_cov_0.509294_1_plen_59_part_01